VQSPPSGDTRTLWRDLDLLPHLAPAPCTCAKGTILGHNEDEGTLIVIPAACGRWDCPHCARRKALAHYARMVAGNPKRHIVLTVDPKRYASPEQALIAMKKALPKLAYAIRHSCCHHKEENGCKPIPFEYAAVWEATKKGWPHVHVASWGCFVRYATLRDIWLKLTHSPIVHIHAPETLTCGPHHWTKYLLKAVDETASMYSGHRLVTYSAHYNDQHADSPPPPTRPNVYWHYLPIPYRIVLAYCDLTLEALPTEQTIDSCHYQLGENKPNAITAFLVHDIVSSSPTLPSELAIDAALLADDQNTAALDNVHTTIQN